MSLCPDRRTRAGKAWQRGYADGIANKDVPEGERLLSTWRDYDDGYLQGLVDGARHKHTEAELSKLRTQASPQGGQS